MSFSDQQGLALKLFHLDVKSHGASVLLEADRGALAAARVFNATMKYSISLALVSTQKVVPNLQSVARAMSTTLGS